MEACEIDCGRKARRASADDQAVENGFIHPLPMDCDRQFPTSPRAMNWSMLFIAFALAVIMGMAFSALLLQLRPQWSPRRRILIAASWLPIVVIMLTLVAPCRNPAFGPR